MIGTLPAGRGQAPVGVRWEVWAGRGAAGPTMMRQAHARCTKHTRTSSIGCKQFFTLAGCTLQDVAWTFRVTIAACHAGCTFECAWLGLAWLGLAWLGLAWLAWRAGQLEFGAYGLVEQVHFPPCALLRLPVAAHVLAECAQTGPVKGGVPSRPTVRERSSVRTTPRKRM